MPARYRTRKARPLLDRGPEPYRRGETFSRPDWRFFPTPLSWILAFATLTAILPPYPEEPAEGEVQALVMAHGLSRNTRRGRLRVGAQSALGCRAHVGTSWAKSFARRNCGESGARAIAFAMAMVRSCARGLETSNRRGASVLNESRVVGHLRRGGREPGRFICVGPVRSSASLWPSSATALHLSPRFASGRIRSPQRFPTPQRRRKKRWGNRPGQAPQH